MKRQAQHIALDMQVAEARAGVKAARAVLKAAVGRRREWIAQNQKSGTRVSAATTERVAALLSPHQRRNVPYIAKKAGLSDVAVRSALRHLIAHKRARRIGHPGQRFWVYALEQRA